MIPRNNPTASPNLRSNFSSLSEGKTSGIKPRYSEFNDLNLLCASCTVFDEKEKAIKRVLLRHERIQELFRCPQCNRVYSERQVRHVLKLDLPEYIYYDEDSPKEVDEINREREKVEKFVIKPINSDSPDEKTKRKAAKVIK